MIGEMRADLRIASIVQILHNIHRAKGQQPLPLKDFVLKFEDIEEERKVISSEQLMAKLRIISAMHGSDVQAPKVIQEPTPAEAAALAKAREAMNR